MGPPVGGGVGVLIGTTSRGARGAIGISAGGVVALRDWADTELVSTYPSARKRKRISADFLISFRYLSIRFVKM